MPRPAQCRPTAARRVVGLAALALTLAAAPGPAAADSAVRVLDARGKDLGTVFGSALTGDVNLRFIEFMDVAVREYGQPPILVRVDASDVHGSAGDVLRFEEPGCAGPPWIFISLAEFDPESFFFSPAPSVVLEADGRRELWAMVPDSEPAEVGIRSFRLREGFCSELEGVLFTNMVPAELVDDDFFASFPPPYRIAIR